MLLYDARVEIDSLDVVSRLEVTLSCSVPNFGMAAGRVSAGMAFTHP
jgi:hypothetical protein